MLVCIRTMRFSVIKKQYNTNEISILEVIFFLNLSESNDKSLTVGQIVTQDCLRVRTSVPGLRITFILRRALYLNIKHDKNRTPKSRGDNSGIITAIQTELRTFEIMITNANRNAKCYTFVLFVFTCRKLVLNLHKN